MNVPDEINEDESVPDEIENGDVEMNDNQTEGSDEEIEREYQRSVHDKDKVNVSTEN